MSNDYAFGGDEPHDIFDPARMSDNLDRSMTQAEREALRQSQVVVRPAQLLLGMLQQPEASTAEITSILRELNVSVPVLIQALGGVRRAPTRRRTGTSLELAPAAANAVGLAFQEADGQGSATVGTGHVLIGLLREPRGEVAAVLNGFGITQDNVRRHMVARARAMQLSSDSAPASAPRPFKAPTRFNATPMLDKHSRDITKEAREGKLDPFIGGETAIREMLAILGKRRKNNPALIGEPGVGKTATVEGLAQFILAHPDETPEVLRNRRLVTLDLNSMVAGSKYRGEFEERLKGAIDDVLKADDVMLFIDEFHTIIGAGGAEGAMDASNILKPLLATGRLRCIGATTLDEFSKRIEKDPALERRFRPVYIDEPTIEQTLKILEGVRSREEQWHGATLTDAALEAAARLSQRFIPARRQPDKSLDLIDEACSRAKLKSLEVPAELREMEARIEVLAGQRRGEVNLAKREELRGREMALRQRFLLQSGEWQARNTDGQLLIGPDAIAEVVAAWSGIPVAKLTTSDSSKLIHMEDALHERLIGQDEAVKAVAGAVRRARAGVGDPKRPQGVLMFLGPTGVGKTELAKALAEYLFDDESALVRLDMSEYQEKHSVSRLNGPPPGYVGYEEGGQLTEPVRRRPYSVVLFDEIEKAHPDVFDMLLQVMDDGRLTDTKGRVADFKNTILIMTSNLGVRRDGVGGSVTTPSGWAGAVTAHATAGLSGPATTGENYVDMANRVRGKVKETFKPEWLNRVDEVIVFGRLDRAELRQIVDIKASVLDRNVFSNTKIHVQLTKRAADQIAEIGYDPENGARPINRAMTKIEDKLTAAILNGELQHGDTAQVDFTKRVGDFTVTALVAKKPLAPAQPTAEREVA